MTDLNERPHPTATLKEKNGLEWWQWTHPDTGILQIELTGKGLLSDSETAALAAEFLDERHYEVVLRDSADVYKPRPLNVLDMLTGESHDDRESRMLLSFRKGVIPLEVAAAAGETIKDSAKPSLNRGIAAGKIDPEHFHMDPSRVVLAPGGNAVRARYYTVDGVLSNVNVSNVTMGGILGNFNSNPRNPYCRQTAYTRDYPDRFGKMEALVRLVSEQFRQRVPARWAKQRAFMDTQTTITKNGWDLWGTVFTTLTVNFNFRTACHQDNGDYEAGFGNITVVERGDKYTGGHTVFPKFRVAADVRTGDYVGMDVHEWHGNTELKPADPEKPHYERCTLVCYCRVKMAACGSIQEEAAKADVWAHSGTGPMERAAKTVAAHEDDLRRQALLLNGQEPDAPAQEPAQEPAAPSE